MIIDHWNNFSYFDIHTEGKEPSHSFSVPEQLFQAKLEKAMAVLSHPHLEPLKEKIIRSLRQDISGIPQDSVPVKDRAMQVAQVKEEGFWKGFNQNSIEFLQKHICPLMRTRLARDFHSLRFDIDILEAQTALINKEEEKIKTSKVKIQKKVEELPPALNQVREKEDMIAQVKAEKFWDQLSEDSLEELRVELRRIMQYRSQSVNEIEKLTLEDMTLIKENIEFGPEMEQAPVAEYRKKLEDRIQNLLSENKVLQRLKDGEEIDNVDIEELAGILQSEHPYITLDNLQKIYDNRKARFIDCINHILGLQKLKTRPEMIAEAFDRFIREHSDFHSDQIRFLQILKTFIIERGRAERQHLVSPPFTNLHQGGITGVFKPHQIEEILSFVKHVSEDF